MFIVFHSKYKNVNLVNDINLDLNYKINPLICSKYQKKEEYILRIYKGWESIKLFWIYLYI